MTCANAAQHTSDARGEPRRSRRGALPACPIARSAKTRAREMGDEGSRRARAESARSPRRLKSGGSRTQAHLHKARTSISGDVRQDRRARWDFNSARNPIARKQESQVQSKRRSRIQPQHGAKRNRQAISDSFCSLQGLAGLSDKSQSSFRGQN